jgi:uncharacterized protein HemX
MKSILYVGATLMIGASIYGFVDYKQTSHKKEFTTMYSEEKLAEPAMVAENKELSAELKKEEVANTEVKKTEVKKSTTKKKKSSSVVKKKRKFSTELFSRGALDDRFIEPVKKDPIVTEGKATEEKKQ